MIVNPERYSTTGVVARKKGVCLHTSESGDGSWESLKRVMEQPGDRPIDPKQPNGRKFGSAYHAGAKNNIADEYEQVLPATAGPFSAPPLNKTYWHFVLPGRAGQTRAQWLGDDSRHGIRAAAKFIVDKAKVDGFPLVRITVDELLAGGEGYFDHLEVNEAFDATDHTDVGPEFPWDVLAADIAALGHTEPIPDPEDDMNLILYRDRRFNNVFRVGDSAITIGGAIAKHDKGNLDEVDDIHDESLIAYMRTSGLRRGQMVINGEPGMPEAAAAFLAELPTDLV